MPTLPFATRRTAGRVFRLALTSSLLAPFLACGSPRPSSAMDSTAPDMGGAMSIAAPGVAAPGVAAPGVATPPAAPPVASPAMAQGANAAEDAARDVGSMRELSSQRLAKESALSMQSGTSVAAVSPAPRHESPAQNALPAQLAQTAAATAVAPAMVIRSGQASMLVDSLAAAVAALQRVTASVGGYVGNTWIATGADQVRRATLELKIPVSRYDDAVAGLAPLGKVESVTSSAEDVGEEYTDLAARIANAHRLEERLVTLLAERTGKLQDALMVERELARVREEIERYEGRARFLGARVAVSTLTVSLHEAIPLVANNPGQNVLVEAAKEAWRTFVLMIALAIKSLGVVVPVVSVVVLGYLVRRRRRPVLAAANSRVSSAP